VLTQCYAFARHHRSGHRKHSNYLAVRRIPILGRVRHEFQQCQVGGVRPIGKPRPGERRPQPLDAHPEMLKSQLRATAPRISIRNLSGLAQELQLPFAQSFLGQARPAAFRKSRRRGGQKNFSLCTLVLAVVAEQSRKVLVQHIRVGHYRSVQAKARRLHRRRAFQDYCSG